MVTNYGEKEPFIRNVFTLDTCAPIIGSEVRSYSTEDELLDVSTCFHLSIKTNCLLSFY